MQASAKNSETVLLKALQNAKKNLLWLGILVVAINGYSLLEFGQHSRNLNSAVNSDQQARGNRAVFTQTEFRITQALADFVAARLLGSRRRCSA